MLGQCLSGLAGGPWQGFSEHYAEQGDGNRDVRRDGGLGGGGCGCGGGGTISLWGDDTILILGAEGSNWER